MTEQTARPQAYKPDEPVHRIQTVEPDGERRVLFRHDFTRLDSSNLALLLTKERETVRIREKMGKGRTRPRNDEHKADGNFYRALVTGGGFRPASLQPVTDLELVSEKLRELYATAADDGGLFHPGWYPLTREQMLRFTPERMKHAVDAFLSCKAEYVAEGDESDISFMFDEGGLMKFRLLIGDPDAPAYRPLFAIRRPESQRRANFRDSFAYSVESSKGDVGKVETVLNYAQGVAFFDEHFATLLDDPEHSPVVLDDKREDREPQPVSAVGDSPDFIYAARPYDDTLRSELLRVLNPVFKTELASGVVYQYSQTDRE